MTGETADRMLERVFQAALGLAPDREETLWRQFAARRPPEPDPWITFGEIMLQIASGLRQSIQWTAWPAHGVPGLGTG